MNNKFNDNELVNLKGKLYPVVGGRLRLAHEAGNLQVSTKIVTYDHLELAVVEATVMVNECNATGHGMASINSDARLKDSLLELAETRAIARALRFCGFGVEYTGHEEMQKDSIKGEPKKETLSNLDGVQEDIFACVTQAALNSVVSSVKEKYELTKDQKVILNKAYDEHLNKLKERKND